MIEFKMTIDEAIDIIAEGFIQSCGFKTYCPRIVLRTVYFWNPEESLRKNATRFGLSEYYGGELKRHFKLSTKGDRGSWFKQEGETKR